jgi:hypothetical protein
MKLTFNFQLFLLLATVISTGIFACKQESEELTPAAVDYLKIETNQNLAFNIHNDYLDFIGKQLTEGKINHVNNPSSLNQLKVVTKQFFSQKYGQDVSLMVDQAFDMYFQQYSNTAPKLSRFGLAENAAEVQKMQVLISSDMAVEDFIAQTNLIIKRNSEEILLNNGLASVVGVAQGSYTYWKGSGSAHFPNTLPQDLDPRECDLCLFALADLAGAADGAAIGTLLGGVGAGPGAVMGGAIYSGLTALSW